MNKIKKLKTNDQEPISFYSGKQNRIHLSVTYNNIGNNNSFNTTTDFNMGNNNSFNTIDNNIKNDTSFSTTKIKTAITNSKTKLGQKNKKKK